MLLGLTGVGKSTMMHILSGRQMYLVEDGTNDMIKVLDECIPGSVISETANSETKVANAVRIKSPNDREYWLLIDTPGFGDTAGPIDNIVNAVSIANKNQPFPWQKDCPPHPSHIQPGCDNSMAFIQRIRAAPSSS